eukprot:1435244-Amphidinium_carterae.1
MSGSSPGRTFAARPDASYPKVMRTSRTRAACSLSHRSMTYRGAGRTRSTSLGLKGWSSSQHDV